MVVGSIKRGFTLIELLAVIVILAIISTIAIPVVINIIEESRKKSIVETDKNILKSSKMYIYDKELNNDSIKNIIVECDGKECRVIKIVDIDNNEISTNDIIEIDGRIPYGTVKIKYENKNFDIESALYLEGYCFKNENDSLEEIDNNQCKITTNEKCFAFNSQSGTITSYKCYEGNNETCDGVPCPVITDVTIPQKINNVFVEKIGSNSFSNRKLTSLDMSLVSELKIIDNSAFLNNNISGTLDLSKTSIIKIGIQAFYKCNEITKVIFPKTLEEISSYGFRGEKIEEVDFSLSTNLKKIGTYAFSKSPIKGELDLRHTSLIEVAHEGFAYNRFTKILLPKTLTTIGTYAFCVSNNNNSFIESVTIPASVTSIGNGAFNGMYQAVSKPKEINIMGNEENQTNRFCENWDSIFGPGALNKALYCEN